MSRKRLLHRVVWAGAVLLIAWWTLLPFSPDLSPRSLRAAVTDIQWVPFVERGRAPLWSDVLGNVALFLPFGFAAWRSLERSRGRLLWVLVGAAVVSLSVELLQLTLPARRSSATDLAVDMLGAAAGAGLGRVWEVRGRRSARSWWTRLTGGGRENLLALLFAAILIVWAMLPGAATWESIWEQTQLLSSSFRRFPGWEMWLQRSWHPMLLGAMFAILAGRSGAGSPLGRGVFGFGSAVLLGLVLELTQLLAPGRSPNIFSAVGFGAGGLLALVLAAAPALVVRAVAVALVAAGFLRSPQGDNPELHTFIALALGGILLFLAAAPRSRAGVGEPVRLD